MISMENRAGIQVDVTGVLGGIGAQIPDDVELRHMFNANLGRSRDPNDPLRSLHQLVRSLANGQRSRLANALNAAYRAAQDATVGEMRALGVADFTAMKKIGPDRAQILYTFFHRES